MTTNGPTQQKATRENPLVVLEGFCFGERRKVVKCSIWTDGTCFYPVINGIALRYMRQGKVYQVIDRLMDDNVEPEWTEKHMEFVE